MYSAIGLGNSGAIPGLVIPLSLFFIMFLLQKNAVRVAATIHDLAENQKQLQQMVFFDTLTGLPNRKMISDRLNFLIQQAHADHSSFSIVFIDLDNFKKVNDVYGHSVGDQFLKRTARFINSHIDQRDMLGRLGGDEFILIIQRRLKDSEIYLYVNDLRSQLQNAKTMANYEIAASASFGIATFPTDAGNADDLLKFADTAMYGAKESGKNSIQFFNQSLYTTLMQNFEFEQNLRTAIANHEMYLNYQPQFTAYDKRLRGFEVLLRWISPQHGVVNPDQFIPVAEETGQIIPIGEWVLRESCRKMNQIEQFSNHCNLIMSVNISVVQIMDAGFLPMIDQVLSETRVNPKNLEFEVTESVFISSFERVNNILNQVKGRGIHLALDDFGTGFSSLNYLQVLPIDTLKIDKSFVYRIGRSENKEKIIGSLITLVHQLGLPVVAEGVENEFQKNFLLENSCDYIQGYLWGKPLAEPELDALLEQILPSSA